ncbi:acyl-CoA dehydrogenase family protein [Streptomyces sp. NPDC088732]|uniref:acyl-CoA dehydrogenase family protein n=1 Tax=Streptomyces sp. NPDC088732 TaxID=3365879 RepID=UPI0038169313
MSDPHLTDAHVRLRENVRKFAEAEIAAAVPGLEGARGSADRELATLIARQGWIGATIDRAYGGMGAGHLAKTIIIEEISRVSGAMGAMVQASQLGTAKIIHYGTDEQKRTWLPQIASGDCLPTIAVTEPGSGSHVLGVGATGRRRGRNYVLTGRKVYVGNSHIGHLHGIVVRTRPGSRGLTAFLVEADRPGLTLAPEVPALGLHGFSFGEVILDNCPVPAANMIGQEGDGLAVAYSSSVLYGRPNLTAVALGIHQAVMEEVTAFTSERHRYGRHLHDLANIKLKVGQIASRLMTARLTAYHAAHLLDTGRPCDADLMNAKLVNTELAIDSARAAMEIEAAAGLLINRPLERFLRDALHLLAPAGTSDIQLLRLGEAALGLGKAQWSEELADAVGEARSDRAPHTADAAV